MIGRGKVIPAVLVLLLAAASCGPRRLKDIARDPDDRTDEQVRAERHLQRGRELFDHGDAVGAQARFLSALREDPMLYKAHLYLADIYELEGDRLATLAEQVAHTELAPRSREYLDRMWPYVHGKFSRNPAGPDESDDETRSAAMLVLSEAVDTIRRGKREVAFGMLAKVKKGIPRAGLVEYIQGSLHLDAGEPSAALEAFARAVEYNPYFARLLLTEGIDKKIPGMSERLLQVLSQGLKAHPADQETALLLASLHLGRGEAAQVVKITRQALGWGHPRWDLLLVKAAAHRALGQTVQMEQALSDLKEARFDPSVRFHTWGPSEFQGQLGQGVHDLARERLAQAFDEPIRSYFLWRLAEEGKDAGADQKRLAFYQQMKAVFPPEEFENLPGCEEPETVPRGLLEFMGFVQNRVSDAMESFQRCDRTRRSKRGNPSGRIVLRVQLSREGRVAQVGVVENSTGDDWLAYCIVRKILPMRFPRPLRATESFKIPVMLGPEADPSSPGRNEDGKEAEASR